MPLDETIERRRLRRHFATVLAELHRAAPPPGASPQRRAETLRELARYARAGVFPRHGGRGAPRPVFVDHVGTRCAMAHLLEWNGEGEAVHQVAAIRNHAYVPELAASPEIADAIRRLGVSEEEAANIQPAYEPSPSIADFAAGVPYALLWLGVAAACCVTVALLALVRGTSWSARRVAERRRRRAAASEPASLEHPAGAPGRTPWRTPPAPPPAGPRPASSDRPRAGAASRALLQP